MRAFPVPKENELLLYNFERSKSTHENLLQITSYHSKRTKEQRENLIESPIMEQITKAKKKMTKKLGEKREQTEKRLVTEWHNKQNASLHKRRVAFNRQNVQPICQRTSVRFLRCVNGIYSIFRNF